MKVYSDPNTFNDSNVVLTIGMFDGVHLGHSKLLEHTMQKANALNAKSVVLTFWPHPRIVLNKANPGELQFITTLDEKTKLISEKNIDALILLPFSREIANLTAEKFIQDVLIKKLGMKHLVVGYNHRFGKDRVGDYEQYLQIGKKLGFSVSKVDAALFDDKEISSTYIRNQLNLGQVKNANQMLGYQFSIFGTVTGGQKLGRRLGYPTANIIPNEQYKLIPAIGVYACKVHVIGQNFKGMINIGKRPTVDNTDEISIEVHIFNFNQDIYSEEIEVFFVDKIREEMKFNSIEDLKLQLKKDESAAKHILELI